MNSRPNEWLCRLSIPPWSTHKWSALFPIGEMRVRVKDLIALRQVTNHPFSCYLAGGHTLRDMKLAVDCHVPKMSISPSPVCVPWYFDECVSRCLLLCKLILFRHETPTRDNQQSRNTPIANGHRDLAPAHHRVLEYSESLYVIVCSLFVSSSSSLLFHLILTLRTEPFSFRSIC